MQTAKYGINPYISGPLQELILKKLFYKKKKLTACIIKLRTV